MWSLRHLICRRKWQVVHFFPRGQETCFYVVIQSKRYFALRRRYATGKKVMRERRPSLVRIAQRGISGNKIAYCFTNALLMSQYPAPAARCFYAVIQSKRCFALRRRYATGKKVMRERRPSLVRVAQRGISGNKIAYCFTNALLMSQYCTPVGRS